MVVAAIATSCMYVPLLKNYVSNYLADIKVVLGGLHDSTMENRDVVVVVVGLGTVGERAVVAVDMGGTEIEGGMMIIVEEEVVTTMIEVVIDTAETIETVVVEIEIAQEMIQQNVELALHNGMQIPLQLPLLPLPLLRFHRAMVVAMERSQLNKDMGEEGTRKHQERLSSQEGMEVMQHRHSSKISSNNSNMEDINNVETAAAAVVVVVVDMVGMGL